jgi:hypothetical protein
MWYNLGNEIGSNKQLKEEVVIIKECSICHKIKELSEFYSQIKNSKIKGEYIYYVPYCKDCAIKKSSFHSNKNRDEYLLYQREYSKEYMKNPKRREYHREIVRTRNKEGKTVKWQRENPDKVKIYTVNHRQHEINKQEWINCKKYFNNSCAYCGLSEKDHYTMYLGKPRKSDLHKEHIAHDGANDLSNCVPACRICNSSKWKHNLDEWYNSDNPNYLEERIKKINMWLNEDYLKYKESINT